LPFHFSSLPTEGIREGIPKEGTLKLISNADLEKKDIGLKEHHEHKARVFESPWCISGMK